MIIFTWSGFPQYAARCIGAFVAATREKVFVVATRPRVPVEGMERACGCPVLWHDADERMESFRKDLPDIDSHTVVFCCGWNVPYFNELRDAVKEAGGRAILMNDANYVLSVKTVFRAIRFRMLFRRKYDGFLVPGKSGRRMARFNGVPDEKIAQGMYVADPALFRCRTPISARPKEIIYVGQFIDRKNVMRMCQAFASAGLKDWKLRLYGSGPLRDALMNKFNRQDIQINDFVQPEQLAELYQSARVFCLPSLEEHWGVVVHEAALSGCYLLLSKGIGAGEDFLGEKNGYMFDPLNEKTISDAFARLRFMEEPDWNAAETESLDLASRQDFTTFISGVSRLVGE